MLQYSIEEMKKLINPGMIVILDGEEYEITSLITDPEKLRAGIIANVRKVHGDDTFILKK